MSSIISLGSKIIDIGDDAFTGSGIATILLPSSLAANTVDAGVGGYGLNKVEPLTSLSYEDGVVRIAPSAMIDCQGFLSKISLPATLQSIGDYAFAEIQDVFPRITNLNLSSATHLLSIGDYAFYNAVSSLAENKLVLPPSLTAIGEGAFAYNKYAYTQVVSSL